MVDCDEEVAGSPRISLPHEEPEWKDAKRFRAGGIVLMRRGGLGTLVDPGSARAYERGS